MSLKQRGDTIVEVIAVLAILGLAVSIAYATANTSLLDARQAQENSQAAERVATQIEDLIVMSANPSVPVGNYIFGYAADTPFCIDSTNANAIKLSDATSGQCQYDSLYNISITGPGSASGGLFTVTASWPDVEGHGTDTVTLSYRLYPPPPPS